MGVGRTGQERPPPTYIPWWETRWARGFRERGRHDPRGLRADTGVVMTRHVSFTPHNPFLTRDLRKKLFDQARFSLSTT